ncbi:MAG: GNAT family N-acetyltransferase [Candidatus Paceibacterota bacterium]|jgi:L-amino acid N-acyltransferase YncA
MATKIETLPSDHIEISPLKETDIDQFNLILEAHVRDRITGEVLTSEIKEIKGYMRGELDEYGRERHYFVARDKMGKVLGCMAYSIPDPDTIKHFQVDNPNENIELLNAFVSPEIFRGGGIGNKLLQKIISEGKRLGKKQLLINSGPRYQKSWGFYDKFAEQADFIQNKYGEGGHAKTWKIALQ